MTTRSLEMTGTSLASRALLLPQWIGFFFAFRLFFVLLSVRIFGQEGQVGVAFSLALNYVLLGVVAFHSFGVGSRTLRSMLSVPCVRTVLLFLLMTGTSLLWSSTASFASALAFWCAMAADTVMVALLLRTEAVDSVAYGLMRGYVWGTAIIAVAAWLMPAQSDLRLGDEEYLGPNQIGFACAFAFFFAQFLMRRKQGNWSIHAALLAVTLLRSLSKTTIIAFCACQGYIFFRDRSMRRRTKWLMVILIPLVLIVFSGLFASYYDVYLNEGNQSETLSGRVGIWAYFVSESLQQPWFGHGFHSIWKVVPPFYIDQFEARHAHNELLQQFYAYGLMGIAMLLIIYGNLFRQMRRVPDDSLRVFFIGMFIFAVVRGLADTEAFDLTLPLWTILLIGFLIEQSRGGNEVLA